MGDMHENGVHRTAYDNLISTFTTSVPHAAIDPSVAHNSHIIYDTNALFMQRKL